MVRHRGWFLNFDVALSHLVTLVFEVLVGTYLWNHIIYTSYLEKKSILNSILLNCHVFFLPQLI